MVICSLAGRVRLLAFSGFPTRLLNSKSKISLGQKVQMPIVTRTRLQMPIGSRTSLMTRISASFSHVQVNEYINFSAALHSCPSGALASNSDKGATQDGVVAATGGEEDQGVNSKGGDNGDGVGDADKGPGNQVKEGNAADGDTLSDPLQAIIAKIGKAENMRDGLDQKAPGYLAAFTAITSELAELRNKENRLESPKPAADLLPAPTTWTGPTPFCRSGGKDWNFQLSKDWIPEIEKAVLQHFEKWEERNEDKVYHPMFYITGAPGTGKSRSLDEFPEILKQATTNSSKLRARLNNMYVFNVNFESGKQENGNLTPSSYVPARMAFQLYEDTTNLGWAGFLKTSLARNITILDIMEMLMNFSGVKDVRDLTILILIDGVHSLLLEDIKVMFRSLAPFLTCKKYPFFVVASAAIVQIPIQKGAGPSSIPLVRLTLPRLDGSHILGLEHAGDPIKEVLVRDMDGHGRALEFLQIQLKANPLGTANAIMSGVRSELGKMYSEWNAVEPGDVVPLLATVVSGRRFPLPADKIPGTNLTADEVCRLGLFRFDDQKRLRAPYIWLWIMCEKSQFPLLQNLNFCDYNHLEKDLNSGTSAQLSFRYFEEICCTLRALRSHTFADGEVVDWCQLHSGAVFGNKCSLSIVNRHLPSVEVANKRFNTRSSINDSIALNTDVTHYADRKNAVFLNAAGAEYGDGVTSVLLENGSRINEVLQMRRYDSENIVTAEMVSDERSKAADSGDMFVLYSNGQVNKTEVPDRTAIVDAEVFEEYFGPFAARAFVFGTEFPLNVNTATQYQLELCRNVGEVKAENILNARKTGPFKDADDMKSRVRHLRLSKKDMAQFKFSDA